MLDTDVKAEFFKLTCPIMSRGHQDFPLAKTDLMKVVMKSYAEGGENELHAHPNEDHMFVVLQGQARFYDKDEKDTVIGRHEGIMIPRGAYYWFQSCGDEPLVMLRVGAYKSHEGPTRLDVNGKPMAG